MATYGPPPATRFSPSVFPARKKAAPSGTSPDKPMRGERSIDPHKPQVFEGAFCEQQPIEGIARSGRGVGNCAMMRCLNRQDLLSAG